MRKYPRTVFSVSTELSHFNFHKVNGFSIVLACSATAKSSLPNPAFCIHITQEFCNVPPLCVVMLHAAYQKFIRGAVQREGKPHDDVQRWDGRRALNAGQIFIIDTGTFADLGLLQAQILSAAGESLADFKIIQFHKHLPLKGYFTDRIRQPKQFKRRIINLT